MRPKPEVHICSLRCKIRCLLGHCYREDPESKCRCCLRFNRNTAHELSRSQRSETLEDVRWWEDLKPVVTEREKALTKGVRRLLERLGQVGKLQVYPGEENGPTGR